MSGVFADAWCITDGSDAYSAAGVFSYYSGGEDEVDSSKCKRQKIT
jgi:hypothetical protein